MCAYNLIIARIQNTGTYRIYNPKALGLGTKQSEGATKGLRVISSVDPCVLKSNFLDYRLAVLGVTCY